MKKEKTNSDDCVPFLPIVHQALSPLTSAFPRVTSFLYFCLIIFGMIMRNDSYGVTAFIRALGLGGSSYQSLIKHFERVPVCLDKLVELWCVSVFTMLGPLVYRVEGRPVLVGDSTKHHKRGRFMPCVKRLRASTKKASKAEMIDGHHVHVTGLLAGRGEKLFCIPLIARLCEGLKRSPSDKSSVLRKMLSIHQKIRLKEPCYAVFDRYYCAAHFIRSLLAEGHHIVVRVRSNAVCREGADKIQVAKRAKEEEFTTIICPWDGVEVRIVVFDEFWERLKLVVRWVVIDHPSYNSPMLLLSTDLKLSAETILYSLYAPRFKIEVMFKALKHELHAFMYRFWTGAQRKAPIVPRDTYTHRMTDEDREKVLSKINSYNYFLQCAAVAQGILNIIALLYPQQVLRQTRHYYRTLRDLPPTEFITRNVLRYEVSQWLESKEIDSAFGKFLALLRKRDADSEEFKHAA